MNKCTRFQFLAGNFVILTILTAVVAVACHKGSISDGSSNIQIIRRLSRVEIEQVLFEPNKGKVVSTGNPSVTAGVKEWLLETTKYPVSKFSIEALPVAIHRVKVILSDGESLEFRISGGKAKSMRITILMIGDQLYKTYTCPDFLIQE